MKTLLSMLIVSAAGLAPGLASASECGRLSPQVLVDFTRDDAPDQYCLEPAAATPDSSHERIVRLVLSQGDILSPKPIDVLELELVSRTSELDEDLPEVCRLRPGSRACDRAMMDLPLRSIDIRRYRFDPATSRLGVSSGEVVLIERHSGSQLNLGRNLFSVRPIH